MQTLVAGPTPVVDALAQGEELLERANGDLPLSEAGLLFPVALLEAYRGNATKARELAARHDSNCTELALPFALAISKANFAKVEMVGGDSAAAELRWRESCDILASANERNVLSTGAAELAEKALYAQGKYEEAEHFAELSRDSGAKDDILTQARWRGAMAKVTARQGEFQAAERLAREALERVEPTDHLELQGDVLMDAAEVFRLASRHEGSLTAARRARAIYEAKGITVCVRHAEAFVKRLSAAVA